MLYTLSAPDLPAAHEAWLFQCRERPDGPPVVRPEYRPLVCRGCNRVDERAALERGVHPAAMGPPTGRDVFVTRDHWLIVSERSRAVLAAVPGLRARFFPVPGAGFAVLFPEQTFAPPADAPLATPIAPHPPGQAFQVRGRPCRKCGRWRAVTFRPEGLAPPADLVLAGAWVEVGPPCAVVAWLAGPPSADAIRAAGLTGWRIDRVGTPGGGPAPRMDRAGAGG